MAIVRNAKGVLLPYSDPSVSHFSATNSGPDLYGSVRNDSLWGDSRVNVTMHGGPGDDIYHLYSAINRADERPGEGIDTVETWMSYTLPANIENLTVTGNGRYAIGNDLNNIISGGSGKQTIDGGLGDDVLKGGGGSDTFLFEKGNGSDLILDFGSDDNVRLTGYGFSSFAEVKANMVQSGSDVRLNLGPSEFLVFANTSVDQLKADQFELSLDRSHLKLSFSDEFDTLSLRNGTSGTWDTNFWWGAKNGSTLTSNGEKQWYIDHDYAATNSVHPVDVENGVLTITAARADDTIKPYINNYDYTSGLLNTYGSFAQTYGYFEIRADMPENHGVWPAFWLLPADGSWPPELDVVEMRGQDPNTVNVAAHSNETGSRTTVGSAVGVPDTEGFHNYGLLWTEDELVWYFDDTEIFRAQTPSDMHKPMYMLVNLAVGGAAGTPADGLATPAEMQVDYIRAYELNNADVQADDGRIDHVVHAYDWWH
ncbi:MAG TPA: family 16 glycosylhydrolase [Mesorhizobium sp.]|jgi:beta-glucanase (GH16 family)|uniref:family 16 glycosylhydrolase n=1 Tax=Mesorhizobium sp. TaxID=1871066 RepID=UPI002DDCFCAF|nr:family 16 glycosylhydrolase [Mesorhizobium sp.]HEV2505989.1 family 16 glycosylhydrolase [Mesorhizobium sp.]